MTKLRFRSFFMLLVIVITLSSCDEFYHKGTIKQEVVLTEKLLSLEQQLVLKTVVWYDGEVIMLEKDKINVDDKDAVETLKCSRYNEAIELIDKIRAIEDLKCEK